MTLFDQTTPTLAVGVIVREEGLRLTKAEERLILRLRQARRRGEQDEFLLNIRQMTLRPLGSAEVLDKG